MMRTSGYIESDQLSTPVSNTYTNNQPSKCTGVSEFCACPKNALH
jgi:hypothetical protein